MLITENDYAFESLTMLVSIGHLPLKVTRIKTKARAICSAKSARPSASAASLGSHSLALTQHVSCVNSQLFSELRKSQVCLLREKNHELNTRIKIS